MIRKLLALVVVLLVGAGVVVYVASLRLEEPFKGYSEDERFVEIAQGASPRRIGDDLIAAGVVRDRLTFRVGLWESGTARRLQAGEYRFERPMSVREVIDKIARGDVYQMPVTFPEGLTIADDAKIFEAKGLGSAAEFLAAAKDVTPIAALDPAARDLEGYLFPETYPVTRRVDATKLVRAMVERFMQVATPELRAAATARGLNVRQFVTLASIVEKETGRNDERPLVAAVYVNRLRIGMALQCDPTVIYALEKAGKYDGNLRKVDLDLDSPYNTYRYPGLPPGPIAAPGKASLEAVARPANADYLYFVSRNDGSHEFARSLAEHNRNVAKFQVQYFRRARAR